MNVDYFQSLTRSACGQSVDGVNPIPVLGHGLPWRIYGRAHDLAVCLVELHLVYG